MMNIDHTIGNLLAAVLDDCAQHTGTASRDAVVDYLRQGDDDTRQSFYRGLGQQVAQFLGTWDEDIKAVYLCHYASATEHARFDMFSSIVPIHLIVWTRRKTAALQAFIAAIDRALVQGVNGLCNDCQITRLLDTQFIDDADIKDQTGYGVLLFSLGLAPTQVWRRAEQPSKPSEQPNPTSQLAPSSS